MKTVCRNGVLLLAAIRFLCGGDLWAKRSPEKGRNRIDRDQREGDSWRAGRRPGQSRENGGPPPGFYTEVPPHLFDIVLGRPTQDSVTVSLLAYEDIEGFLEYGMHESDYARKTDAHAFRKGEPKLLVFDSLEPNTRYHYRLRWREPNTDAFQQSEEYTFHTQRPPGEPFVFTLQADAHLDYNTGVERYERTLTNAQANRPDFHIDLGDTFMTGKYGRDYRNAESQYLAQRYYFGLLCHSAPLFLVLGNHDGESGAGRDGAVPLWSVNTRKKYFPNPRPNGFYSGNKTDLAGAGALENYYAWEWGDAQLVVLDPFWPTTSRAREGTDFWNRTLGKAQYQWLESTLKNSTAKFKFVFIHHLVGGLDKNGRGGSEAARLFEWGGRNLDGSEAFGSKRPGWSMPIHQLLIEHKVSVVFHGHDHFYAQQDLDGIKYQLVPQPGHKKVQDRTRSAAEYGYRDGVFLGSSGHLRITVTPAQATIDYVRSYLPGEENGIQRNAVVAHSYTIEANREPADLPQTEE